MRKILTGLAITAAVLGATSTAAADQPAPHHILIMGSSTTACAGDLTTPANCYVNLVKVAHPLDQVTVLGRGGTYIGYGTAAQNWTTTPIPSGNDRVIVQLGINDWYVPVPPTTLRQQIDKLLIRVKTANPGAAILWVRTWMPTPTGNVDVRQSTWAQHGWYTADALYYARTSCNPNCTPVADFADMGTTPNVRRSTAAGDGGWHYNDRGHAEIAQTVNAWLDRN